MAKHVYHWKHGWIPLDHTAALSKAKGNREAADKMLTDAHSPQAGIHSREHVAKAAMGLSRISDASHRSAALKDVQVAAERHNAMDSLPKALRTSGNWQRMENGNRVRETNEGITVTDGERTVHIQATSAAAIAAARALAGRDLRNLFEVARKKPGSGKHSGEATLKLNADGTYTGPKAWAL